MSKDDYTKLLTQAKQYLSQEFHDHPYVYTSKECFDYFKSLTKEQKKQAALPQLAPIKTSVKSLSSPVKQPEKKQPRSETPAPNKGEAEENFSRKRIELEPLPPIKNHDLSPQLTTIQKSCPKIQLLDHPPVSCEQEKQMTSSNEVCLLVYQENEQNCTFLNKIVCALTDRGVQVQFLHLHTEEELKTFNETVTPKKLYLISKKNLSTIPLFPTTPHIGTSPDTPDISSFPINFTRRDQPVRKRLLFEKSPLGRVAISIKYLSLGDNFVFPIRICHLRALHR